MAKAKTKEEKEAEAKAKNPDTVAADEKAEAEAKKAEEKAAKEAEKSAKLGASKDEAVVFDSKTGEKRVYSKEKHGKNYKELAEEFAGKVSTRKVL